MPKITTKCIDCGNDTLSGGLRCRACHSAFQRKLALDETAEADRKLLAEVDTEGLSGRRVAARYGVSVPRAMQKIADARRREAQRQAQDQYESGAVI